MSDLTVCTVVARNYLPGARVLARSVLRHHPGADMVVLVIDDLEGETGSGEPFRVLHPRQIGLGGQLGAELVGIYSVREFATAAKPWLVEHLLRAGNGPVFYLDPDIVVYSPLDGLAELASLHDIAVTPHTLRPFPRDGRMTGESAILAAGIYNLGFIGVGQGGLDSGFLDFWKERLRRDGIVDVERMLFTDQRWIDFIDCFPHAVVRDTACNVAYWNVWGRTLSRVGDQWLVDGSPLRFYHFSGFDPRVPYVLSVHQGDQPRVLLSEHPLLAELCRSYAQALFDDGFLRHIAMPYARETTPSGLAMDPVLRSAYRTALIEADAIGADPPPGPFDADGGVAFTAWVREPVPTVGIPRCLYALWSEHPDLQQAFPNCLHDHRTGEELVSWAREAPDHRAEVARRHLGPALPPPRRRPKASPVTIRSGLNVLGYLQAEDGVGQAGRLLIEAAASAGIPVSTRTSRLTPNSQSHESVLGDDVDWPFDLNVFCVNADALALNLAAVPAHVHEGRRSAGVWFWEAEVFPEIFWPAFELVDEVWAPSRFVADTLEKVGLRPVRHLPMPVPVPTWRSTLTRSDLGLPEGFLVLFTFDWSSIRERKNPDGLIEAYSRAFAVEDGAQLVLKSVNGDRNWRQLEELRLSLDRPDIQIIDTSWRSLEIKAALEACDCYASLHRSEGFGLAMAEAMALAKPVVATGWSGNLDFMNEQNSHLIPSSLVSIPESVPVYGGLGRWAEPDLDAAAAALRQIYDDPVGAAALGARARASLLQRHTFESTGRNLKKLSEQLRLRGRRAA